MVVRAFNVPVSWLVCGLVVWNEKSPDTGVTGAMPQPSRSVDPKLMMLANTVATFPTWTERLPGRMEAATELNL